MAFSAKQFAFPCETFTVIVNITFIKGLEFKMRAFAAIVFTGFAIVLRRLSVMAFSAKQFAFPCETFPVIVDITVIQGLGFQIGTFAAIVFTGFAIVLRRLSVMAFSAKQFAFPCETFTVIVNITFIKGLEFKMRAFAAIVFTGFAIVLRRLSVMAFSAKQFAFPCETFPVIVDITVIQGLGFQIGTFAAIVFTGFAIVLRRLPVMAFSAKQFAFPCETFTVIVDITVI